MTTDNRTNEPTPEQVEAAAEAIYFEDCGVTPDESTKATDDYGSTFRELARAVLVAAAGVAPVQPSSTVPEAALIREAKAEALTEAVEMVHEEEHAFVDKMWGTVVPKLTIIEALRARAAEYREGSKT